MGFFFCLLVCLGSRGGCIWGVKIALVWIAFWVLLG